MSGLAGVFKRDQDEFVENVPLCAMLNAMLNRGPDALNLWSKPGIGFGHARLSVIDLSQKADQPMVDLDTGHCVMLDGTIFNYVEIRQELEEHQYRFYTHSDTEVILKAYDYWGEHCFNRFNGMWAIALFDAHKHRLLCARDHLGIKPFFFAQRQDGVVFASEAKAIAAAFPEFRVPDGPVLHHFLKTGVLAATEETLYKGIFSLLPGHYLSLNPGQRLGSPKRYWQWEPKLVSPLPKQADVTEAFRELLTDALRIRFRSDVPVSLLLDGRLESTSLVALSHWMGFTPLTTLSCVFQNPESATEDLTRIRTVIKEFQCQSIYNAPGIPPLLPLMRQSVWELDGPSAHPEAIFQQLIMATARGKSPVIISATGAEELFGHPGRNNLKYLEGVIRTTLSAPSLQSLQALGNTLKSVSPFEQSLLKKQLPGEVFKLLFPAQFDSMSFGKNVLDDFQAFRNDALNTSLLENFLYARLPAFLQYEDRTAMAFGLQSRLPFLDIRLVEFMFSLPSSFKMRAGQSNLLLSEACKSLLPATVIQQRRPHATASGQGVGELSRQWFQNPALRKQFSDLIMTPPETLKFMNIREVARQWTLAGQGQPYNTTLIWRYLTTCFWFEQLEAPSSAWVTPKVPLQMAVSV